MVHCEWGAAPDRPPPGGVAFAAEGRLPWAHRQLAGRAAEEGMPGSMAPGQRTAWSRPRNAAAAITLSPDAIAQTKTHSRRFRHFCIVIA